MDSRRRLILAASLGLYAGNIFPQRNVSLPKIGLGTWQTFDVGADDAARAPLREVLKLLDGNVVDSSPMYGTSEAVAGDLIAELKLRERLFVATKVWTQGRDEGIRQMAASFKRLRVQQMDLLQVHNLLDVSVHARTLQDMKAAGKVRFIGITHYTASAYGAVERELKANLWYFLQINYSLGERDAEKRILPLAAERRVAVIVNRPFQEGVLFQKAKNRALPAWAKEYEINSWAQYFLKWIVSHPAVTCAIPGTGRPDHMRDNLGAGHGVMLDEKGRQRLAEYFDAL
jgi:diketogulonate reductase-like aldo/keto reductase